MGSSNSKIGPLRLSAPQQAAVPNGDGNATACPNMPCHKVVVKAICALGQTIYLGTSVANAISTSGFPLKDGDVAEFEVSNANQIFKTGDAANAKLAIFAGLYT